LNEQSTPFDAETYQAPDPQPSELADEAPDASAPDASAPDASAPDASAPDASAPVETEAPARRSWFRPWMAVLGGVLPRLGAGLWWQMRERARWQEWRWGAIEMPEDVARVPAEWTAKTLAERLQKSGKVHDAAAFREAAAQVNLQLVQPGAYPLPKKAGPLELAKIFNQPPPLVKVTFPEGWTASRMANRLEANHFDHAGDFRVAAYPPGQVVSPWEGRLFPDTYYLLRRGSAAGLMEPMKKRYREIVATLPRPFPAGPQGKPLSLEEVTTLASLVERETSVAEERPLIAGVLLNRLRTGMRLQVDATVQYARERAAAQGQLATGHKERLLLSDLKIVSPYNTYRNKGLPPGPICNPGEAALRAAARPKSSEYLFYVMSPELGRHRFARTFAEHRHNIALARQEKS
jgi:UPF0755 protein